MLIPPPRALARRAGAVAFVLAASGAALAVAPAVADAVAHAQSVRLQIRPRVGDTLRLRLDQRVEMVGTTRVGRADSTLAMVSMLAVATRIVVQGRDRRGTVLLAITDSVAFAHSGTDSARAAEAARRHLQGHQVRLRMAPNGATTLVDGAAPLRPDVRQLFAQMPATLPDDEVSVGDRWARRMEVPLTADPRTPATGVLDVTFRLDSISRAGDHAFVSMSGQLRRTSTATSADRLTTLEMEGEIAGTLLVDRRRGWITDARTTVVVFSLVGSKPDRGERAVRTRMTVTQRLKAW